MNEMVENDIINIEKMIYEIDGKEVMLDTDLAEIYKVETKRINEAVKNNPNKFPERYLFRISDDEYNSLKSKISTSKGGSRKGHTAFTEQGIYMLATILNSKVAIEVSIRIMDTFVKMRHYINLNKNSLPNRFLLLEDKVDENTKRIDDLFNKFNSKDIIKDYLILEGEFYDAYSLLFEIFNSAKKEIIIIDNYAGKELFDLLRNIDKHIIIVTNNDENIMKKEYMKQYKNIDLIHDDSFHDRYVIIDRQKLYNFGASLKDLGKKCFSVHHIKDNKIVEVLIDKLELSSDLSYENNNVN